MSEDTGSNAEVTATGYFLGKDDSTRVEGGSQTWAEYPEETELHHNPCGVVASCADGAEVCEIAVEFELTSTGDEPVTVEWAAEADLSVWFGACSRGRDDVDGWVTLEHME